MRRRRFPRRRTLAAVHEPAHEPFETHWDLVQGPPEPELTRSIIALLTAVLRRPRPRASGFDDEQIIDRNRQVVIRRHQTAAGGDDAVAIVVGVAAKAMSNRSLRPMRRCMA